MLAKCFVCDDVYVPSANSAPLRPEDIRSLGTGNIDGCETPFRGWELNLGSLKGSAPEFLLF